MKYEEFLQKEKEKNHRKKPNDEEHRIQSACVKWFRLQYPKMRKILFSVPNGGRRDIATGTKLKEEGSVSGVSDLIFLKRNRFYSSLCIEMKTPDGIQSLEQKEWQREAEAAGNKYAICRSVDDFIIEVTNYFNDM